MDDLPSMLYLKHHNCRFLILENKRIKREDYFGGTSRKIGDPSKKKREGVEKNTSLCTGKYGLNYREEERQTDR